MLKAGQQHPMNADLEKQTVGIETNIAGYVARNLTPVALIPPSAEK
ncbi:MAG: hypothetical protein NTY81_02800 [Candidatus Staskawiczbacteria bacterium]|nr:hypothetical protein [Candidatus Staskawiczbacteria bacterium]